MDKKSKHTEIGSNNVIVESSEINNLHQLSNIADTEFETSQDLFNDNESSVQNSPSINLNTSQITKADTSIGSLLITPTQISKILKEDDRSPAHAIIPTIPTSLMPFISTTINESWTSDLETPQAEKTSKTPILQRRKINYQPNSHESMNKDECKPMSSSDILPNVRTPNGYLANKMEDESVSNSPILQVNKKRRLPKRRILKSFDTTITTSNRMDFTCVDHNLINNASKKTVENLSSEKTNENESCDSNNKTSIPNCVNAIISADGGVDEDETNNVNTETFKQDQNQLMQNNILDSRIAENVSSDDLAPDREENIMKENLRNCKNLGETLENEKKIIETVEGDIDNVVDNKAILDSTNVRLPIDNTDETVDPSYKKYLADRLKKIKELQKQKPPVAECKYDDIPIDVFTRDAKALENAELSPVVSRVKSRAKNYLGFMSFTQMCSLEEKTGQNECSNQPMNNLSNNSQVQIKETNEITENIEEAETVLSESIASFFDDRDIVDVFPSSVLNKNEAVVDADEFSPWFYQSDETNTESTSKNINTTANQTEGTLEKVKMIPEIISKQQTSEIGKEIKNEVIIPQSFHDFKGFSTASGKPVKISEDKIRKATDLYNEIASEDGNHYDYRLADDNNEAAILGNSSDMINVCTTNEKTINHGANKLKEAEKLHKDMSSLMNKIDAVNENSSTNLLLSSDFQGASKSRGIKRNRECYNTDPNQICGINSSVGFTTACGKPLVISESAMKKAKTMYQDEDILKDEFEQDNELLNQLLISEDAETNKSDVKNIENIDKTLQKLSTETCKEPNLESEIIQFKGETGSSKSTPDKSFPGFSTADGKSLMFSHGAFQKAKAMFMDLPDVDNKKTSKSIENACFESMDVNTYATKHKTVTNKNLIIKDSTRDQVSKAFTPHGNLPKKDSSDIRTMPSFSKGFTTAGGKAITVSDQALSNATTLLSCDEQTNCDINFLDPKDESEYATAGFSTASGKLIQISDQVLSNAKMLLACEEKTACNIEPLITKNGNKYATPGFSTASGKPLQISDQALSNAKKLLVCDEQIDSENNSLNSKVQSNFIATAGFSTASGEPIKISDQALSSAKILLNEEECSHKSGELNLEADDTAVLGFSMANGKGIKISEESLRRAKTLFADEQENTPPQNPSTKRSSLAMETCTSNDNSAYSTSEFVLEPKKILSEEKFPETSIFQKSKKAKLNYDLQTSNLYSEKDYNINKETENVDKCLNEKNKVSRSPLISSNNHTHNALNCKLSKNASSLHNNMNGMHADSEMFPMNDRSTIPMFEPQKSSPLNQNIYIPQSLKKFNCDNMELTKAQTDRKIFTISDEIIASTEALLADEENSNNAKSWAPGITCGPTIVEDREISAKPITFDENCDVIQEVPTSPIIGIRFRSRKKNKRKRKSLLKKNEMIPDFKDEQIITQPPQKFSCGTSSTLSLSEGSHENTTTVETSSVSTFEKHKETSKSIQTFNNQSKNSPKLVLSEFHEKEAIVNSLENRIAATLEQEKKIRTKKKFKPKPIPGSYYLCKTKNKESRVSWRNITNGVPPVPLTFHERATLGIEHDVIALTAATAPNYRFKCSNFYSNEKVSTNMYELEVGDGAKLIFDANGYAGAQEFEQAFMASPGVDPALLPQGWVENHYRWIVWKLASMDRMKFGALSISRMLTPDHVMKQLKYRYDREIDKSQRPALRRIIEKDDPACRRIVLCVATITELFNDPVLEKSSRAISTINWKVELTDGWYSIPASIDTAMADFIASGKVKEGTKLITYGAELLNSDQGCFPLELPTGVSLKIHSNSTRRARWDTKLGYCKNGRAIPTSLSAILPYGGLIGKLDTIIARVYPIQYYEKSQSGQPIFRNDKCEDKAAMKYEKERQSLIENIHTRARADFEARNLRQSKTYNKSSLNSARNMSSIELNANQWDDGTSQSFQPSSSSKQSRSFYDYRSMSEEAFQSELESILRKNLPPPRKVTPVLMVRVIENKNVASLTIWAPSEDIIDVLREGNRVSIHNVQTSGKRSGELQLTAGRQSFVKLERSVSTFPRRCLTTIPEVAVVGFNPPFGDFDTVGIVASLGPAPHGMKNFEVVNLAYPNHPDEPSTSAYLSILFWEGIGAYGFSDILSVGSIVACTNLQWRRGPPRIIPAAYATKHSTFTRNPRQAYLRSAFDTIKDQITDPLSYATQCAAEILEENQKKPSITRSPAMQTTLSKSSSSTPEVISRTLQETMNLGDTSTPAKYSIQRRLEKLQWYGEPPDLSPITLNHSSEKVKKNFFSPLRTPEKN